MECFKLPCCNMSFLHLIININLFQVSDLSALVARSFDTQTYHNLFKESFVVETSYSFRLFSARNNTEMDTLSFKYSHAVCVFCRYSITEFSRINSLPCLGTSLIFMLKFWL